MLSFNIPVVKIRIWISLAIGESNCTSNLRDILRVTLFLLRCVSEKVLVGVKWIPEINFIGL